MNEFKIEISWKAVNHRACVTMLVKAESVSKALAKARADFSCIGAYALAQFIILDSRDVDEPIKELIPEVRDSSQELAEKIWSTLPKKAGNKKLTITRLKKHIKAGIGDMILEKAKAYANLRKGEDPRYTLMNATWVNQERWNDEIPTPAPETQETKEERLTRLFS